MYRIFSIQVTNRCNMLCPHCCFSCTAEGQDMPLDIFKESLRVAREQDLDHIVLSGGEPTVHPLIEQYVLMALDELKCNISMAINGKHIQRARRLWEIANAKETAGRLTVSISLSYHEPIAAETIELYRQKPDKHAYVSENPSIVGIGRAAENHLTEPEINHICACPLPTVFPDGEVWTCTCKEKRIGHVTEITGQQVEQSDPGCGHRKEKAL